MFYFQTITQGILFGLTLALMVGPAFFSLLQTSISEGFKKGAQLAIGISISDIIMGFVAWFGLSSLFASDSAQKILSLTGGLVLLGFGIFTAIKKHKAQPRNKEITIQTRFQIKYILKGFVFNIANPGIWIFWLIPVGVANSYPNTTSQIIFLSSIFITILAMDMLKCAIANELSRFITDRVIKYLNRLIGGVLMLFGIYLIMSIFVKMPVINI